MYIVKPNRHYENYKKYSQYPSSFSSKKQPKLLFVPKSFLYISINPYKFGLISSFLTFKRGLSRNNIF